MKIISNFYQKSDMSTFRCLLSYLTVSISALITIIITIAIIILLSYETFYFFQSVPITNFLFGTEWSPTLLSYGNQTVINPDEFGFVPLFTGTVLITIIALTVSIPIGLYSAIYLSEFAKKSTRNVIKPVIEILSGVPTVIYGYFAIAVISPILVSLGKILNLDITLETALSAGIVMGIMIIPLFFSLVDDALHAIPKDLRYASLAMGATKHETITRVLLPTAAPAIIGAFILCVSRAVGETMIVVMAAGLFANLSLNPLDAVTTITVQIVNLLKGDQDFVVMYAAYALGTTLFVITFLLNFISITAIRRYKKQYKKKK